MVFQVRREYPTSGEIANIGMTVVSKLLQVIAIKRPGNSGRLSVDGDAADLSILILIDSYRFLGLCTSCGVKTLIKNGSCFFKTIKHILLPLSGDEFVLKAESFRRIFMFLRSCR